MGIRDWFLGSKRSRADYSAGFLSGFDELAATGDSAAVTPSSALGLTAVYACVRIISSTIASLPLITYRRDGDMGKRRATESPVYRLLHDAPNPEMTSYQWRSVTAVHQTLWGAGISEIEFDRTGRPVALWPIPPWRVTPGRTSKGIIYYDVQLDDGGTRPLLGSEVCVFPAMSTSSYDWMSPISVHRSTIGAAIDVREFGARTFSEGTNPAGIVKHPGKLRTESEESLRESLKQYKGLSGAHRLMLLQDGMEFMRVGMPPEDAQYLETRRFDISEIARIYNVPPHLLQDHEKATTWGSGLEELNSGFVTFTLRPYLVQWEQELNRRVIIDEGMFCEFLVDGLLRGKLADRYTAYTKARQNGWMSANEIRAIENLNPIEGEAGTAYLVPLNLQDASKVGEDKEPAVPVEPVAAGDDDEGGEDEE